MSVVRVGVEEVKSTGVSVDGTAGLEWVAITIHGQVSIVQT